MEEVFFIVGILAFLVGLVWVGQGLGYITWPASFMINQIQWTYYGAALTALGCFLIWLSRRK